MFYIYIILIIKILIIIFIFFIFFFFKQKTAYEITVRDWSSDVCSSDLVSGCGTSFGCWPQAPGGRGGGTGSRQTGCVPPPPGRDGPRQARRGGCPKQTGGRDASTRVLRWLWAHTTSAPSSGRGIRMWGWDGEGPARRAACRSLGGWCWCRSRRREAAVVPAGDDGRARP